MGYFRKELSAAEKRELLEVFGRYHDRLVPLVYEDLRRMASYAPVLGKFITLSDYFQHTERPGNITKFAAEPM